MLLARLVAGLLVIASISFTVFGYFEQAIDRPALLLAIAAGAVLGLATLATVVLRRRRAHVLAAGSIVYAGLNLGALVLQIDQERLFAVRASLSAMLLAGVLLALWAVALIGRSRRRYGFDNYYDRHR